MIATSLPFRNTIEQAGAEPPIDVRPILSRSSENAWERTEQIRSDLYLLLERLCAERGLKALVLKSDTYVQPAWVKFESWLPTPELGITARASLTVTIATRPYHRFEWIYRVEWEKHGQKGTFDHVYQLGEAELAGLMDLFAAPPAHVLTRRRVRRALKLVQLRQRGYELWKPRNKVVIIRRDWALIASLSSLLLGATVLAVGVPDASTVAQLGETPFDLADISPPTDPAPPPETVAATSAAPATTETASLDVADPRMDDGKIYKLQSIQLRAGEPFVVTMRSSAFDTYLILGQMRNGSFVALQTNDDGGDDGTNSRIEYVPATTGEYLVVFSSYESGRTGAFTYTLQ